LLAEVFDDLKEEFALVAEGIVEAFFTETVLGVRVSRESCAVNTI